MGPVPAIVEAWKAISVFPGWSKPEDETGYVWFDAPLEIGGVTERGLVLHGGCYADKPNCNVTMELRFGREAGRRCMPLMRLDWRSIQGGHRNPRKGRSEWRGKRVGDTHMHDFDLNWIPEVERLRGGAVRLAKDVEEELETFEDVRAFVGNAFRISNIGVVTAPPWMYDLLSDVEL